MTDTQTEPFGLQLYKHALVNRESGKVKAYARDTEEAQELSHQPKYANCEGKLLKRAMSLAELAVFDRSGVCPPCMGDIEPPKVLMSRDGATIELSAPAGATVIVKNAQSGDRMGVVHVRDVPAAEVQP